MGERKILIESFPKTYPKIEMPTLAELIDFPVINKGSIDDAYKFGGDVVRYLIDNAPLKNDRKYVTIWTELRLLKKNTSSVKLMNTWHVDGGGAPFGGSDRYFILMNDCTATTEFNENKIEHYIDEDMSHPDYDQYLNDNASRLGLSSKRVPVESFIEFSQFHVHRATFPDKDEFRLLFRLCESNNLPPFNKDDAFRNNSTIFTSLNKGQKSIEKKDGTIRINF